MVDPESGDMQMTLTTEGPAIPRLYIGRTSESEPYCSPSLGSAPPHPSQAWQWLSDPQKAIWASNMSCRITHAEAAACPGNVLASCLEAAGGWCSVRLSGHPCDMVLGLPRVHSHYA